MKFSVAFLWFSEMVKWFDVFSH